MMFHFFGLFHNLGDTRRLFYLHTSSLHSTDQVDTVDRLNAKIVMYIFFYSFSATPEFQLIVSFCRRRVHTLRPCSWDRYVKRSKKKSHWAM